VLVLKESLIEFGFVDEYSILRCRLCNGRINKYGIAVLLGTSVKYGWCRWYTHGVSVCKLMK
jgi:hypothetical protein